MQVLEHIYSNAEPAQTSLKDLEAMLDYIGLSSKVRSATRQFYIQQLQFGSDLNDHLKVLASCFAQGFETCMGT